MELKKKYILFFISLLLISICPIFLGVMIYKPVLSVFPQFSELEIQVYYLVITTIFSLFSLFFIYSFRNLLSKLLSLFEGKTKITPLFFLVIILLEIAYIANFYKYTYPILLKTSYFMEVGIMTEDSFAFPILLFIVILLAIIFFSINRIPKIPSHKIFYLLSIILICFLSFRVANLNNHDYAYFVGPINDVLHGKQLLYNVPSQYGFLSILFLSIIFKFIPLSLMNLTIVHSVAVTIGFILVFVLLQFLYKNKLLSIFAIFFIIFLNYVIQILPDITILQTSFLRFGMWVIMALSLCIKEFYGLSKYGRLASILPYLILSISSLWVLDNGVYILLAFTFYKFISNLKPSIWQTLKAVIYETFKIFISIGLGLLLTKAIYRVSFGFSPNWSYYSSDPSLYLGGFGLMPLPSSSWHWAILIGYLIMMAYIFSMKRFSKNLQLSKQDSIFLFILLYGIFQFSYFMGRSHLNNLHHVIIPFLVCLFYLLEISAKLIKKNVGNIYNIFLSLVFSLLICLPAYFVFIQGSKNLISYNLFTTLNVLKNKKNIEANYIGNIISPTSINLLKTKYGNYILNNGITLVSINDIWFLIELNMVNNIESNNLRYYITDESLIKVANSIKTGNYKYVFIDKSMSEQFGQVEKIYKIIKDEYKIKETLGSLLVLEKNN